MKAVLPCLAAVLTALDPSDWPTAVRPFAALLRHCADPRPKVRRRAQTGLVDVLAALQRSPALPDASAAVLQGDTFSGSLTDCHKIGALVREVRWVSEAHWVVMGGDVDVSCIVAGSGRLYSAELI